VILGIVNGIKQIFQSPRKVYIAVIVLLMMYYSSSLKKLQESLSEHEQLSDQIKKLQQKIQDGEKFSNQLKKLQLESEGERNKLSNQINSLKLENSGLIDEQEVLTAQINLVLQWEQAVEKAIDAADEQLSKVQEYLKLKERDSSWSDSISEDEKSTMYILRREIGDLDISSQDVLIYKAYSAKELRVSLDEIVQPLKDSLGDWQKNIEKMKTQQTKMYSKNLLKHVDSCIDKWLAKLGTIPTTKSSYGMIFRGVFEVLKNVLIKTAKRLPGMIVKTVASHIFN